MSVSPRRTSVFLKRVAWIASLVLVAATEAGAQDAIRHTDAFLYGRFGYGTIGGESRFGGPSLGFGSRFERGRVALDILFFDAQAKVFGTAPDLHEIGGVYTHAHVASLMTVKGFYLPMASRRTTPYLGGGVGWGTHSFGRDVGIDERWRGKGFQGDLAIGYAFARSDASTRFFLQADLIQPFYRSERYSNRIAVQGDRRAPSFTVSLGAGW